MVKCGKEHYNISQTNCKFKINVKKLLTFDMFIFDIKLCMIEQCAINFWRWVGLIPNQHGGEPGTLWNRNFILIILVNLVIFISFQMLMPTLPVYAANLGGSERDVGLIIGIFTISAVLIRPYAGKMLDSAGRRLPMLLGLVIFAVAVFIYNWAWSIVALLVMRLLHGVGWALVSTGAGTVATDSIPRHRLGEGMGYFGITGTLSMALAPVLGLFIINQYGFTSLFFISAGVALVALILATTIGYRPPETEKAPRGPLFEPKAYRPSLTIFFVTTTYGAVVSFIALYGQQVGITNIGIFFTVYAIALTVIRPLAGMLADRKGFDIVVIPGLIMILAAMLVLSQAGVLWMFLLAGVLYGLGFGSVQPSMQALAVKDVPPQRRGAANGTLFSAFDLGIGIGAVIWGTVSQAIGYANMYMLAGVPALIAIAVYVVFKEKEEVKHSLAR